MTAPQQPPNEGPIGALANRGVILVLIGLVVGFVVLAQGFGDRSGDLEASSSDDGATETTTTTAQDGSSSSVAGTAAPGQGSGTDGNGNGNGGSTPPTTVSETLHPPAEVTVLAGNGSGETGVAGGIQDKLVAQGYVAEAKNALDTEASQILYRPGYGLDAAAIAETLGVDATVIMAIDPEASGPFDGDAAQISLSSNVLVIGGADGVIR